MKVLTIRNFEILQGLITVPCKRVGVFSEFQGRSEKIHASLINKIFATKQIFDFVI